MDLESTTNPVEDEDNAAATLADNQEVETEQLEPQYDEDGNEIVPDDDEEVEIDPELKLKLPKEQAQKLKEGILRQADYTRKTQEVAEMRRSVGETLQQLGNMNAQEFTARATLMNVDQQLAKYQHFNFAAALANANANYDEEAKATINAAFMEFQQLDRVRQQALSQIGQHQHARQSFEQQETARLIDQGRAELVKHVPGWNDEYKAKLTSFAAGFGVSAQDLSDIEANPGAARILVAAFEGVTSSKKAAKAQQIQTAQQVKPAARVGGGSPPPGKLDDRLSAEEWVRRRDAQVRKRA